ncbi:MAG: hypothetical protein HC860_01370 [Alkalinema sp. RU_4_3]|nr:hypothetical protein [Alkalinema sp. RU_4_3]
MPTILDSQNALKHRVMLAILSLTTVGAAIATMLHRLDPHPHWVNLIAPPLLGIIALALLIRLYTAPKSLQQVINLGLLGAVLFVVVPSWYFTLAAFIAPDTTLVGSLPPLISILFLIMMIMMTALRPRHLLGTALITWGAMAAPILTYLLLHPAELTTLRGLDLVIALGPAMAAQIVLLLFFNRLQDLVDRLYHERLQYYEQIIERQTIRQRAMEQAVTQVHNGPLQTLALLMRAVQREQIPAPELLQRLNELNAEIRAVGQSLTQDADLDHRSTERFADRLEQPLFEQTLRLGEGSRVDLNNPLHNLFHEVYALTLKRPLPHFQTIRVKVRNFAPLESSNLTLELKQDLCLWLEEALCNVGKHAQGVTRLVVTGELVVTERQDHRDYLLTVRDNGLGLTPELGHQGTQFCHLLADRLDGTFQRRSLPDGGVICQITWPLVP